MVIVAEFQGWNDQYPLRKVTFYLFLFRYWSGLVYS